MARPESPCRNCKKRNMTCHANCDGYDEFKKALEVFNKKLREQKADYRERYISARRFSIKK